MRGVSTSVPPKFIKTTKQSSSGNGSGYIRRYNPEYKKWLERQKELDLELSTEEGNNNNNADNDDELDALLMGTSTSSTKAASVSGGKKSSGWNKNTNQQQQANTNAVNAVMSALMRDGSVRCVAPPATNQSSALPTISSISEHKKHLSDTPLTDNVIETQKKLEKDDISKKIGVPKEQIMNNIAMVFGKFEVPIGVLEKLLELEKWDLLEMIVDDSTSMGMFTDSRDPKTKMLMTRWEEVEQRIRYMVEVLAYVPSPNIRVVFLNRKDEIEIKHKPGEAPYSFIGRSFAQLRIVFQNRPLGNTPMFEAIRKSFARHTPDGVKCLRYCFGDGQPSGGRQEIQQIVQFLKKRENPSQTPFTFMSCTNEDEAVEWMKEAEEAALYVAELDDYYDEAREVIKDQGRSFGFSFGLWLICCLVAAIDPFCLDALDESVPLPKATLDCIQGYVTTEEEYSYYFNEFLEAQRVRPVNNSLDQLKSSYQRTWRLHEKEFREARSSHDIPVVEEFRMRVRSRLGLNGSCCSVQ